MSSPAAPEICPVCHAFLVRGRDRCVSCGMAVAEMENLRTIERRAAERRRSAGSTAPPWVRRGAALLVGLLVAVFFYMVYRGAGVRPDNPWTIYPNNAAGLVKQVFEEIAKDTNDAHDRAYALVSPGVRHPENAGERGLYGQLFHEINEYLEGEFGAAWQAKAVIRPRNPTEQAVWDFVVEIGPEKLHVELTSGLAPDDTVRYGFSRIQEFPLGVAGKAQKVAGVLRAVGAGNAGETIRDLSTVRTPMEIKREMLPVVRSPESPQCRKALYQLWPVRNDPVVRHRLEQITGDARYDPDLKQLARHILDENVPADELLGAGVQDIR